MTDYDRVLDRLRHHTRQVVPEVPADDIVPERTLAELGCNSIDRADILTMTMEDLGLAVSVSEFHQGQRLDELASVMARHL